MGYLICDECNGYYELEPGETAADFETCDCGGKLRYAETIDGVNPKYKQIKDICTKCGAENPAGAAFCASCSSEMKKELKSQTPRRGIFDWWDKQEKGTKTGLGIGGICCLGLLVILVFGAMGGSDRNTQSNSTSSDSAYGSDNVYKGLVSFNYPKDWTLSQGSGGSHVTIFKGTDEIGNEIGIDILSISVVDEKTNLITDGYTFKGDKEVSGTKYSIYENTEGYDQYHVTVFLLEKNGKVIEIVGNPSHTNVMEKIVASIS